MTTESATQPLLTLEHINFEQALMDAAGRSPMLIPAVIAADGVSAISGTTGIGKSPFALDIALTLIFGRGDWHGLEIFHPRRMSVIYVDVENDRVTFQLRALAWLRAHGLDTNEGLALAASHLFPCYETPIRLGEEQDNGGELELNGQYADETTPPDFRLPRSRMAREVRARVEEIRVMPDVANVGLVIFDTLARLGAATDTADNAEAERVMTDAQEVATRCGIPVLVVAHPSKAGAAYLETELRGGRVPGTQQLISGAQRIVDTLYSATAMVSDAGGLLLFGQAKCRVAEREDKVYETGIIGVDINLPPTTIELPDGTIEDVPASTTSKPVIIPAPFEIRKETKSKFGEVVEYLRESGRVGQANAVLVAEWDRLSPKPPVKRRTLTGYLGKDWESHRVEAGLIVGEAERVPGQRGAAPKMIWIEDRGEEWLDE